MGWCGGEEHACDNATSLTQHRTSCDHGVGNAVRRECPLADQCGVRDIASPVQEEEFESCLVRNRPMERKGEMGKFTDHGLTVQLERGSTIDAAPQEPTS